MYAKLENKAFIHVVATVDLAREQGAIRYVNPATTGVTSDAQGHPAVEMSVEDAAGGQKKSWHPIVRFASPDPGGAPPTVGLIQEDIPYEPWMNVVRLYVKGKEVGTYEAAAAGALEPAQPAAAGGPAGAAPPALTLGAPSPAGANKRSLLVSRQVPKKDGLTYTVQVKPEGSRAWQTIATGRETPDIEIDRNQFPGARKVDVRVVQTTGFQQSIFAEEAIELEP